MFNGMSKDGRRNALHQSGKRSLSECLDFYPPWITSDLWADLVRPFWSGPEWDEKSDQPIGYQQKMEESASTLEVPYQLVPITKNW